MSEFRLTAKQQEAQAALGSIATHVLLRGGSRSGKTFLIVRAIVIRALAAPGSRHAILRFRFNACKVSVALDTFPSVMAKCFPGVAWKMNKEDWYAQLPGGSEVWFGGLDDKERTEKILGNEYCLDPHSRVLTSDLKWVFAKDIGVDQELIGFPEDLDGQLKMMRSTVEAVKPLETRRLRIITNKGETIVSEGHRFVAYYDDRRHKNFRSYSWREAQELKVGDTIRYACHPWVIGETREDGWLSGIIDGEGWVSKAGHAGVAQKPGVVLDAIKTAFRRHDIEHLEYEQPGSGCMQLRACGMWPSMRLLGITRPLRLLPKASNLWENTRGFRRDGDTHHNAVIIAIEDLGVGPVVAIQTSTRTLIADGFLGHNCTIFLNECSQIPWSSRNVAVTRLAQNVMVKAEGRNPAPLRLKMFYDMNPGEKSHWTYRLFIQKLDPETKKPVSNEGLYDSAQINPADNVENLPAGYLQTLSSLSARLQRRFLHGEFKEASPGALFADELLDKWRVIDQPLPDMQRIVVAVDPSGSGDTDNADNDAIGIIVAGLGTDGNGYCLEDLTVKAGPATWGKIVTTAFERHGADAVVGETNYGGAMVSYVIQTSRPRTPYRAVTATRGKVVRAEPISGLVEEGKIRMVGFFPELEEELSGFTTNGYIGDGSPNRADALVWAMTELFPGIVAEKRKKKPPSDHGIYQHQELAWMAS